jgi:hypothetical protein
VELHLSALMDADDIVALDPDVVIVATGADPTMDGRLIAAPGQVVDGIDSPTVRSSVELLTQPAPAAGSHALLVDDVGQYEAVSAAEYLLEHGVHVTVATRLPMFGPLVDAAMRMAGQRTWLNSAPAEFTTLTRVTLASVRPGKATVRSLAGGAETTVAADLVVLVTYKASRNGLAATLAGRVPDVRLVGDALAARDLQVAIRGGTTPPGGSPDSGLRKSGLARVVAGPSWAIRCCADRHCRSGLGRVPRAQAPGRARILHCFGLRGVAGTWMRIRPAGGRPGGGPARPDGVSRAVTG